MDLPGGLLASVSQRHKKRTPVEVIVENVLTAVPTTHDVIDCPRELNAKLPCHAAETSEKEESVNTID